MIMTMMMRLLRMPPRVGAGVGAGAGGPQQRGLLPVYWWFLLCAMAVSMGWSLYQQNRTNTSLLLMSSYLTATSMSAPLPLTTVSAQTTTTNNQADDDHHTTTQLHHVVKQQSELSLLDRRRNDKEDVVVEEDLNAQNNDKNHDNTTAQKGEKKQQKKKTTTTTKKTDTTANKPLNIVLLYADDWSYYSLGAAGNTYVQTPRLDEMARSGIFFTHNCVVASVCMQSRATLYTGQYSFAHQTFFAYRDVTMYQTGQWNQTLYPLMKEAGYHVGFFGKYHHLEPPPPDVPTFDEFIVTPFSHYVTRNGVTKHITEWNEEDGLNFLHHKPIDKPFFLTISFFATHAEDGSAEQYKPMASSMGLYQDTDVPLPKTYTKKHWEQMPTFFNDRNVGRARFRERYSDAEQYQHHMKNTYRMVTEVDTACGRIIDYLNETGQLDNTLVLFTTDNGNSHGQHGLAEKWYAYEESLRVPLIIRDPRATAPTVISDFTLNIDLAPTILSAAGVAVPSIMQGTDLADLYLRHRPGRQEFLYEFWDDNPDIPNSIALVYKDFKYIYWTEHQYHQAFNLTTDPFEETDLFSTIGKDTYATVQQRMADLQSLVRRVGSVEQ